MDDREKEEVGKITGSLAGALGGARLASVVFPVPLVGPFAGAVVGGVVGSEIGRRLGKAIVNGGSAFVATFVETIRDSEPGTGSGDAHTTPADPPVTGTGTAIAPA
jgi:phage tail tape-measure protein